MWSCRFSQQGHIVGSGGGLDLHAGQEWIGRQIQSGRTLLDPAQRQVFDGVEKVLTIIATAVGAGELDKVLADAKSKRKAGRPKKAS
jgi:hypothetical protein